MTLNLSRTLGAVGLGAMMIALPAGAMAQDFDLDALIEAAKAEAPITVYASTGKIQTVAEAFTAKYGIEATGTKVSSSAQAELMIREYQSGNIVGDLIVSSDAAATLAQIIPEGMVTSWLPPDLAETIPADSQDPLVVYRDPAVWSFNNTAYEECPVDNMWALTGEDWHRKVAMPDPLNKPAIADWFNQLETHWDDEMAAAYEAYTGEALDTSEQSATASWVQALAENQPLLTDSDSAVADAVGAPDQEDPFMGILSSAKYRDVVDGGLTMEICEGIEPFVGLANPAYALISAKTDSPNAAKLFARFMMTEEGIEPMTVDGKISGNNAVPPHPDEASGVGAVSDRLTPNDASTGMDDFDSRQDWQDFWRVHYSR